MSDEYTVERFRALLNEPWQLYVDAEASAHLLTLIEVNDLPQHSQGTAARQPFSLIFRGSSAFILPQRIYRVEHPTFQIEAMFLVPIGKNEQGVLYEAIYT